jgi:hypothetical protein
VATQGSLVPTGSHPSRAIQLEAGAHFESGDRGSRIDMATAAREPSTEKFEYATRTTPLGSKRTGVVLIRIHWLNFVLLAVDNAYRVLEERTGKVDSRTQVADFFAKNAV